MQMLWCWRCKAEMPMLDEEEFAQVADLHRDGLRAVKALRETGGAPLEAIFNGGALHFDARPLRSNYGISGDEPEYRMASPALALRPSMYELRQAVAYAESQALRQLYGAAGLKSGSVSNPRF
jgi:hypothetical protein